MTETKGKKPASPPPRPKPKTGQIITEGKRPTPPKGRIVTVNKKGKI